MDYDKALWDWTKWTLSVGEDLELCTEFKSFFNKLNETCYNYLRNNQYLEKIKEIFRPKIKFLGKLAEANYFPGCDLDIAWILNHKPIEFDGSTGKGKIGTENIHEVRIRHIFQECSGALHYQMKQSKTLRTEFADVLPTGNYAHFTLNICLPSSRTINCRIYPALLNCDGNQILFDQVISNLVEHDDHLPNDLGFYEIIKVCKLVCYNWNTTGSYQIPLTNLHNHLQGAEKICDWKQETFSNAFRKVLKYLSKIIREKQGIFINWATLATVDWQTFVLENWVGLNEAELLDHLKAIWNQLEERDPEGWYRIMAPWKQRILLREIQHTVDLIPNCCYVPSDGSQSRLKPPLSHEGLEAIFLEYNKVTLHRTFEEIAQGIVTKTDNYQGVIIKPNSTINMNTTDSIRSWVIFVDSTKNIISDNSKFYFEKQQLIPPQVSLVTIESSKGTPSSISPRTPAAASSNDNNASSNSKTSLVGLIKTFLQNTVADAYPSEFGGLTYHRAVIVGCLKRVQECLELESVDINTKDQHGNGALHYAVMYHHTKILEYLLDQGASCSIPNANKQTPLHKACQEQDLVACFLLLGHNMNLFKEGILVPTSPIQGATISFGLQFQDLLSKDILIHPSALLDCAATCLSVYFKKALPNTLSIMCRGEPVEIFDRSDHKIQVILPPLGRMFKSHLTIFHEHQTISIPLSVMAEPNWSAYVQENPFALERVEPLTVQSHGTRKSRLSEILNTESRWKSLCDALDATRGYWKELAVKLNTPPSEATKIRNTLLNHDDFSPSRHLLWEWQYTKQATVARFMEILKETDHHMACSLMYTWMGTQEDEDIAFDESASFVRGDEEGLFITNGIDMQC